ncbi:hypothetical protein BGZ83_002440 [Gryganskiella cystojenkinii]|nr:hypothetical protein BGZ83_002440 [Gryganskiella cystojenkinii]
MPPKKNNKASDIKWQSRTGISKKLNEPITELYEPFHHDGRILSTSPFCIRHARYLQGDNAKADNTFTNYLSTLRCLVNGDTISESFRLIPTKVVEPETVEEFRTIIHSEKPVWFKDLEAEDLTL